jgi:hypothetical protein
MGRRRYPWERKQSQNKPRQRPSIIAGFILALVATYTFHKPIFWLLIAVVAAIAACTAMIGICALWERISRPSARLKPGFNQKDALAEKAIGQRPNRCVAKSASLISKEAKMAYNTEFSLIDTDGDERFAAIIDGTFQIGKDRRATPTHIEDFAKAILVDGKDGRFVCADGRKPALLKFSGMARKAVAYRLHPSIAVNLGIPATGTR